MKIEQIKTILRGTEETLRIISNSPEYQRIQQSEHFTTSNDLTLGDAIQALREVLDGIFQAEDLEAIATSVQS